MGLEIEGLEELIEELETFKKGLPEKFKEWLEASGMAFLDIVQDEIISSETVDTRRLLNSFSKTSAGNVFVMSGSGMSLEVGTNVDYAWYVNDGHFTINPNSGKDRRWVPGYWKGDKFTYDPGAKTGMMLTMKWVDGTNYWDTAISIFDTLFQTGMDKQLQKYMDQCFK
ncbi:HK97 gp10 family phage protein [Listeria monocytogenes]|nr:HK97 gp10 family phage protein [Listeria monocytogenes]EJA0931498.1 HK97 gp10 family phage protein [Listeria monocytogenes]EJA1052994.1 HK97 gp10 family phage protein [Listeria monocytogenes]EJA1073701.1 HK97 gp10 family phage protein [Listeria monocytogenes]EJC8830522.1 HK97 gp10 family phage protein [Listeria monocytogenes]